MNGKEFSFIKVEKAFLILKHCSIENSVSRREVMNETNQFDIPKI